MFIFLKRWTFLDNLFLLIIIKKKKTSRKSKNAKK